MILLFHLKDMRKKACFSIVIKIVTRYYIETSDKATAQRFTEYRYSPDGRGVEVVEDGGYQVHLTSYSNTNGCIGVKSESTMNTLIEYVELYPGTSKIVVVSGKETTGGKYD